MYTFRKGYLSSHIIYETIKTYYLIKYAVALLWILHIYMDVCIAKVGHTRILDECLRALFCVIYVYEHLFQTNILDSIKCFRTSLLLMNVCWIRCLFDFWLSTFFRFKYTVYRCSFSHLDPCWFAPTQNAYDKFRMLFDCAQMKSMHSWWISTTLWNYQSKCQWQNLNETKTNMNESNKCFPMPYLIAKKRIV